MVRVGCTATAARRAPVLACCRSSSSAAPFLSASHFERARDDFLEHVHPSERAAAGTELWEHFPAVVSAKVESAADRERFYGLVEGFDKHHAMLARMHLEAEAHRVEVRALHAPVPRLRVAPSSLAGAGWGVFAAEGTGIYAHDDAALPELSVATEYWGLHCTGDVLSEAGDGMSVGEQLAREYYGNSGWDEGLDKAMCFEPNYGEFAPAGTPPEHAASGSCGGGDRNARARGFGASAVTILGDNHDQGFTPCTLGQLVNDHSAITLADCEGHAGGFAAGVHESCLLYLRRAEACTNVAFVAGGDGLFAVTLRRIEFGEELFSCYGMRWWLSRLVDECVDACAARIAQTAGTGTDSAGDRAHAPALETLEARCSAIQAVSLTLLEQERAVAGRVGSMERSGVSAVSVGAGAASPTRRVLDMLELQKHDA